MGLGNLLARANPTLLIKEISDTYLRRNFQNLSDYFASQNQLLDFKFFDITFEGAEANRLVAHGFSYIPVDVLVSQISGLGVVTFNSGLFTNENINITSTGPARVRFYVGRYWNSGNFSPSISDAFSVQSEESRLAGGVTSAVAQAISLAIANIPIIPTGSLFPFSGAAAPDGFLLCGPNPISRITYANLFAVIGTTYGIGDNLTTFNIPNPAGLALAFAGTQSISGISYTRTLGTKQGDQLQDHGHALFLDVGGGAPVTNTAVAAGGSGTQLARGNGGANGTFFPGSANLTTTGGVPRIGTETRMANLALNAIIKT